MAPDERGEVGRQLVRTRHPGVVDENRDYPNASFECSLDLQPDEVLWIVQAALAVLVLDRQPLWSDKREQDVAGGGCRSDPLDEIIARRDVVYVFEDPIGAEPFNHQLIQQLGRPGRFLPPIADEDPARR
jgi:hypothetical protein